MSKLTTGWVQETTWYKGLSKWQRAGVWIAFVVFVVVTTQVLMRLVF